MKYLIEFTLTHLWFILNNDFSLPLQLFHLQTQKSRQAMTGRGYPVVVCEKILGIIRLVKLHTDVHRKDQLLVDW